MAGTSSATLSDAGHYGSSLIEGQEPRALELANLVKID
jgi:hypothetical protein